MAQGGFAFFFLLVLASSAFALVASALQDWQRIVDAVTGRSASGEEELRLYRTVMRAPIDLPVIAQRMLPRGEGHDPAHRVEARNAASRGWSTGAARRPARQLRFHFAAAAAR